MTASIRRFVALVAVFSVAASTLPTAELLQNFSFEIPAAEAVTIHTTQLDPKKGPFLQQAGGGFLNPGNHWRGPAHPTQGNNPVLAASNLVAGQRLTGSIQGNVSWGRGQTSCRNGFSPENGVPKLVAVGQFTNDANIVVGVPGGGVGGTNAFLLRDFENGVTVPSGASRLWISFPDSDYSDNTGDCSFALNTNPIGFLDLATCDAIYGWAYDVDAATAPISVHIYADGPAGQGRILGAVTASLPRTDLRNAVGDDNHAFEYQTPDWLKDGKAHQIYAYGINVGPGNTNSLLSGSPKVLQCGTSVPPPPQSCDLAAFRAAVAAQKIRFAVTPNQDGFTVWNDTACDFPVTKLSFSILEPQENQELFFMGGDVIRRQTGTSPQTIAISRPPSSMCRRVQLDMSFGSPARILPNGSSLHEVNAAIDWDRTYIVSHIAQATCTPEPGICDPIVVKQAILSEKIRFDRTPNNDGFKVWNDLNCKIPVNGAVFNILPDGVSQSLFSMKNDTIPANPRPGTNVVNPYTVLLAIPTTGCIWRQLDLTFGTYTALQFGSDFAAYDRLVNWEKNSMSAYSFGAACPVPPTVCDGPTVQQAIHSGKIRFDRAAGNTGFKVWNDLNCKIPVNAATFTIDANGSQSLFSMKNDTVPANPNPGTQNNTPYVVSQTVPSVCLAKQLDLSYGNYNPLPSGSSLDQYNSLVNWVANGMSAYGVDSTCPPPAPTVCDAQTVLQAIHNEKIRFDRTANNDGFKIWNDLNCKVPVNIVAFNIQGDETNQSLYSMRNDTVPANPNPAVRNETPYIVTTSVQTNGCIWRQLDLTYGNYNTLPQGTSVYDYNNYTNFVVNGMSAYVFGGNCPLPKPNLTITKTANQASVTRGGIATYTISVTNTGTATAQDVVINDTIGFLAGGNVFFNANQSSTACSAVANGSNPYAAPGSYTPDVFCNLGNLAPNQTVQVRVAFTVGATTDSCTQNENVSLVNTASVRHQSSTATITASSQPVRVVCPNPGTPNLTIQKVRNQTLINRGGLASYTIAVTNTGTAAAQNVVVTDVIPFLANGSVTFNQPFSSPNCSPAGQNVICALQTVSPGQTVVFTIAFNVGSVADSCTPGSTATLLNTASVSASNAQSSTVSAAGLTVQCSNPGNPSLVVQKIPSQTSVSRGAIVNYTITVQNVGAAAAQNVLITDPLPVISNGSVTFQPNNSTPGCFVSGNQVTCAIPNVAAGQTVSVQVSFKVGLATDSCTPGSSATLVNTASISANGVNPISVTAAGVTVLCPNPGTPNLSITKTTNQTSITRGQSINYTIDVANNGTAEAQNVTVTDQLPTVPNGSVTLTTYTGNVTCVQQTSTSIACNVGSVPAGQHVAFNLVLTVGSTQDSCTAGSNFSFVNKVFASALNATSTSLYSAAGVTVNCANSGNPNLSITKTPNQSSITRGGTASYSITVTNNGNALAQNVTVVDPVPSIPNGTVTFVANQSSSECSVNGGVVTCSAGSLAAGQSKPFTVVFTVGASADSCTPGSSATLVNTATASATGIGSTSVTANGVSVNCGNSGAPNLSITKSPTQSSVTRGGTINYTINVTNNGNAVAQNVTVTDQLPTLPGGSVTLQKYTGNVGCSTLGTTVICSVGTIAPNQSVQFSLLLNVGTATDSCGGAFNLVNTASASAVNASTASVTANGVTVNCPNNGTPSLSIVKSANTASVTRGSTITYTVAVTNNGTATAQNITVTDQIPSLSNGSVTFVSAQSSSECSLIGSTVTCTQASLAAGATKNFTLVFTIGSAADSCQVSTSLSNTATVSATGISSVTSNTVSSTVNCPTPTNTTLSITKTPNQTTVNRGGIVSYSIVVTNTGTASAQGVTVTDPIPSLSNGSVTFVASSSSTFCSLQGSNVVCTFDGVIPAGQQRFATIAFKAGDVNDSCNNTNATLTNTASTSATNASSASVTANGVTVQCTIAVGGLQIEKTDNQTTVAAGGVLTYQIKITNPGSQPQTGVTVTDTLPSLVSYVSASDSPSVNGSLLTWNNLTIPGNSFKTLTVSVLVSNSAVNGAIIINNAFVNGISASDTTTVSGGGTGGGTISLSVSDSPDPVDACDDITYTIRVTNTSSQTVTNLTVNQTFNSSDLRFSDASDGGFQNGNGVRWNNITLSPNVQRILTSRAEVDCDTDDNRTVTTTVTANDQTATTSTRVNNDGNNGNGDISITATGNPDEVEPGDTIVYTIRVTNDSNDDATVDVRAELDPDTTFLDASANGRDRSDDEVLWSDLRLDRDETRTLRLEVRVRNSANDGDTLRMIARADNDEDTVNTDVVEDGGTSGTTTNNTFTSVSVSKSADRFDANPGDEVMYTITISNTTSKNLTNLQVVDTFPGNLMSITEAGGGAPNGSGITWNNISLNANQTRTLIYRGRISFGARPGDVVHNTVVVSGGNLNTPSTASADVRLITYLPQTGASDYTRDLENSNQFLSPFRTAASNGTGAATAAFASIVLAGVGFILRRRFLI